MADLLADKDISRYIDHVIASNDMLELSICRDHHGYLLEAAQAFASDSQFVEQSNRLREILEEVSSYPELIQRRLVTGLIYHLNGGRNVA